ncbi:hypothetical protein [Maioricimonas sp. JC845]|uniref:hypothetical protein n=1 Tax=Maioricimonas sp. JC845 TaxID=3232138 RepID=UPI00345A5C91
MTRLCFVATTFLLMFVAFFGSYDVSAQGDVASGTAEATSEKPERRRPLPTYFGKIGVTDEQREQLYAIQDEYHSQIDALQQQIRQLIRERDERMEQLLTPGQKLRLQELREEARRRARERQSVRSSDNDAESPDNPSDS